MEAFILFMALTTQQVELFCWKRDPARQVYCMEEILECVGDGETKQWCQDDYARVEEL